MIKARYVQAQALFVPVGSPGLDPSSSAPSQDHGDSDYGGNRPDEASGDGR